MKILDPCCGSRMMYFDKQDQRVLFGDIRQEEHYLKDRDSIRHLEVKPDIKMDFTRLPFDDESFRLVVFGQVFETQDGTAYKVEQIDILTYPSADGLCAYFYVQAVNQNKPHDRKEYTVQIE